MCISGAPADGTNFHVSFYPDPRLTAHSYKNFFDGSQRVKELNDLQVSNKPMHGHASLSLLSSWFSIKSTAKLPGSIYNSAASWRSVNVQVFETFLTSMRCVIAGIGDQSWQFYCLVGIVIKCNGVSSLKTMQVKFGFITENITSTLSLQLALFSVAVCVCVRACVRACVCVCEP